MMINSTIKLIFLIRMKLFLTILNFCHQNPGNKKNYYPRNLESLGFYISNHPLNEYQDIFNQLNITSFHNFNNENINEALVAGTIMSIQEKKVPKEHLMQ